MDLDEVAHYEPPHQDLHVCKFSYFRLWYLELTQLQIRWEGDTSCFPKKNCML